MQAMEGHPHAHLCRPGCPPPPHTHTHTYAGLSVSQIRAAGKTQALRPGCAEVLQHAAAVGAQARARALPQGGDPLAVCLLSLNWSDEYVGAAVEAAAEKVGALQLRLTGRCVGCGG